METFLIKSFLFSGFAVIFLYILHQILRNVKVEVVHKVHYIEGRPQDISRDPKKWLMEQREKIKNQSALDI
jgi:hypothetical protein